jgi:hypothetical protein
MSDTVRSIFKFLYTIIVFMVIVFSSNLVVNYFKTHFGFLRSFFGSKVYEVTKASENLPISPEPDKTIDITRMVELRKMLQHEQLEELNTGFEINARVCDGAC